MKAVVMFVDFALEKRISFSLQRGPIGSDFDFELEFFRKMRRICSRLWIHSGLVREET
jgi:hypothetical protein